MSRYSPNFIDVKKSWFDHLWIKGIFFGLIFTLIATALYALKILLIPITVGFLLAFIIEPIVSRLEAREISRPMGISIVFLVLGLLTFFFWAFIAPVVIDELMEFHTNREFYLNLVIEKYGELKASMELKFPGKVPWQTLEHEATTWSQKYSSEWIAKIPVMLAQSGNTIMSYLIIIPLFAFFVLKDGLSFKKWVIQFIPNRYFELALEVLHNINSQTGAFLRGQILDSILNAILVSALLFAIDLPYWLLIGCFAGAANAIPFVGPIVAGTLGVAVSILSGAPSPYIVIGVFVFAHLIDVMFIYPKTVGHSLNLHEMVVILGIIIGGHVGGILGMLVVIPILGILFRSTQVMYRLLRGYHII